MINQYKRVCCFYLLLRFDREISHVLAELMSAMKGYLENEHYKSQLSRAQDPDATFDA
jgi:hypothetical protein